VSLGRDPLSGHPNLRTKGVRGTKREAEAVLAKLLVEVNEGQAATSGSSIGSLIDEWLEHIESLGRSPTTMNSYRSLRKQLPKAFLAKPLRNVTPKMIDDLYRHLGSTPGRGPSTVHHFHRLLRSSFNQGMKWGLIATNPAKLATPPRVPHHEIVPPSVEDVRAVLKQAAEVAPIQALWFRMLVATGCRRSELSGMRWSDLNFGSEKVSIRNAVVEVRSELVEKDTKTHQQRTVTLDRGVVAALRRHRDACVASCDELGILMSQEAFVFSDAPDGSTPIAPGRMTKAWIRHAKKAGVSSRLHDLRHFQASVLLDAGESITTVAARLGHRDTSTTLRVYAHLMPGADGRAAEIIGDLFDD